MTPLTFDLFWNQFVLSAEPRFLPPDWTVYHLRGRSLAVNRPLDVTSVCTRTGEEVGLLLGHAIFPDGMIAHGNVTLPVDVISAAAWETFVDGLGGWFVAVLCAEALQRVYVDPMASMGVTYSTRQPIVASTSTLVQLVQGTTPETANAWGEFPENRLGEMQSFPGGITADPLVNRVLPNHYLDLASQECRRWWPKTEIPYCPDSDADSRIETIHDEIRKSLRAVGREFPLYVTLTAGDDTRMILASVDPDILSQSTFFSVWPTFEAPHPRVLQDAAVARQLAHVCGLSHVLLPTISPNNFTEDLRRAYLYRIGYAGHWRKGSEFWLACQQQFPCADSALVMAFGGEVTTYPFGTPPAKTRSSITPERLVHQLKYIPHSPRILDAMDRWRSGLPEHVDIDRLNDLLWLENALACLSLTHLHGVAAFRSINIPFSQRRLIEASYQIPPHLRRSRHVSREIFRRSSLPLTAIPCNGQTI